MQIQKVKSRSVIFRDSPHPSWDLNIHLILGRKYNYIIDTGLGSGSVNYVKEYIKLDHKPSIIINTHYHWDHIWGNSSFRGEMIIAHSSCREAIDAEWNEFA